MNEKIITWLAVAILFTATGAHAGEECVGLNNIQKDLPLTNEFFQTMAMWLKGDKVDCGSLTSVADKWAHRNKTSGKRLEKEKPFDPKEAEANLKTALADSAIQARLNKLKQAIADENGRLFLEAAIFDEEGYYAARELRIQQLLEKMK